ATADLRGALRFMRRQGVCCFVPQKRRGRNESRIFCKHAPGAPDLCPPHYPGHRLHNGRLTRMDKGYGGPKRGVGVMNRLAVSLACIGLAGCSSLGSNDALSTGSTGYPIKLESDPPGADARTSVGPGCQTPCTVAIPARGDFTVTFSLA